MKGHLKDYYLNQNAFEDGVTRKLLHFAEG